MLHWQPEDQEDAELRPLWSGWVDIFRGAPSWESHPELIHGLKALQNAPLHQPHLLEWTWDLPDEWEHISNVGDGRKYMVLEGGRLRWRLVLRFSPRAPFFAFKALADAFNASLQGDTHGKQGPQQRAEARVAVPRRRPSAPEVAP